MKNRTSAFTLIELLVVITIIAILAGLLFTAMGSVGKMRDRTAGMSNVRQVGLAFTVYAGDHDYNIPGRVQDGTKGNVDKWPAILAGYQTDPTSGVQTYNANTDYIKDVRIYLAPGYCNNDPNHPQTMTGAALATYLVSNAPNHTSWTMNGYNDLGDKTTGAISVRINKFQSPSQTILLGMHQINKDHFYMDFADGDNKSVLKLDGYGSGDQAGSVYVMVDGSARYITLAEYNKPSPSSTQFPPSGSSNYNDCYGDWLWLSQKP